MAKQKVGKSKSRKGKARKRITRRSGGVSTPLDRIVTLIN